MYCKNCGRKIYISDGVWLHEDSYAPLCFDMEAEPRDDGVPENGNLFTDKQKKKLKKLVDQL